jgi:hypothetical protein
MLKTLSIISILTLVACGQTNVLVGPRGVNGSSCSVSHNSSSTTVFCTDGTSAVIENGSDGQSGANGYSSLINIIASASSCANGGITVISGLDSNSDGILTSTDTNIKTAEICNGENGQDGQDGKTPAFSAVSTIAPCGNTVAWKEQLLCLGNGKILASFSENVNGLNTRLAFITDGSYLNTDSSNCSFNINTLSDGSTQVSWNGGSTICENQN